MTYGYGAEDIEFENKYKQKYFFDYAVNHIANTISGYYMVLKAESKKLKEIKEFENYVLIKNKDLYCKIAVQSKIIKLLRKTNYNKFVYKILSIYRRQKMKKFHK